VLKSLIPKLKKILSIAKREEQTEGVREKGLEVNIWTHEGG
jgi:hypothetical protein